MNFENLKLGITNKGKNIFAHVTDEFEFFTLAKKDITGEFLKVILDMGLNTKLHFSNSAQGKDYCMFVLEKEKVPYLVNPSKLDKRKIKCACDDPECKVGIGTTTDDILLIDKFGKTHLMELNKKTILSLIKLLKSYL